MEEDEVVAEITRSVQDILSQENLSAPARKRLEQVLVVISEDIEVSLRVDKTRELLAIVDADAKLPAPIRTQLWHVNAMLELL